jgi:hypothetical protein
MWPDGTYVVKNDEEVKQLVGVDTCNGVAVGHQCINGCGGLTLWRSSGHSSDTIV